MRDCRLVLLQTSLEFIFYGEKIVIMVSPVVETLLEAQVHELQRNFNLHYRLNSNSLIMEESCPVCWRTFGLEVVPVCLMCGHSCCLDCSSHLRTCALCRQKIGSSFQRKPNYALISMLEKARSKQVTVETQATQTEPDLMAVILPQTTRLRTPTTSVLEGKCMRVQVKKSGIHLEFK